MLKSFFAYFSVCCFGNIRNVIFSIKYLKEWYQPCYQKVINHIFYQLHFMLELSESFFQFQLRKQLSYQSINHFPDKPKKYAGTLSFWTKCFKLFQEIEHNSINEKMIIYQKSHKNINFLKTKKSPDQLRVSWKPRSLRQILFIVSWSVV